MLSFAERRIAEGIATTIAAPLAPLTAAPSVINPRSAAGAPSGRCRRSVVGTLRTDTRATQARPVSEPISERRPRQDRPTAERTAARLGGLTHKDIAGDRELDLIRRYQGGDRDAGEILLHAHAKFIAKQATFYGRRRSDHDLEDGDILAAGQIGFLKGVERFDPTRGFRLITYVDSWIRSRVGRAIMNDGYTIRAPNRQIQKSDDSEMYQAVRASRRLLSLDAPIGDDDGRTIGEQFADDAPSAEDAVEAEERRVAVERLLASAGLDEREHAIVSRRLMTDTPETLEAVGAAFGVSRERIRQIEAALLVRLRRSFAQAA